MRKSSLINAFTLLSRKPFLLLLLLPMQAALPLALKFTVKPSLLSTPDAIINFLLVMLACYGVILLFQLIGSIFLVPPSMELLQDGAAGTETEPGWYGRGLKGHWWKPVTLGTITFSINFVIGIFINVLMTIVSLIAMIPLGFLSSISASADTPDSIGGLTLAMMLATMIPYVIMAVVKLLAAGYSSLLLPALADRSFGSAFKAVFSKRGFIKVMKLFGVMLLLDFLSVFVVAAFGAAYIMLAGVPSSFETALYALLSFAGSWTYLFVMLLVSLLGLYKYSYSFCLFSEIKKEEEAEELKLLSN